MPSADSCETRSVPTGQKTEAGIVVSDGRWGRTYEDFTLPDLGVSRSFEGSILEARPGRYQEVLGGQGYDFPSCLVTGAASKQVSG